MVVCPGTQRNLGSTVRRMDICTARFLGCVPSHPWNGNACIQGMWNPWLLVLWNLDHILHHQVGPLLPYWHQLGTTECGSRSEGANIDYDLHRIVHLPNHNRKGIRNLQWSFPGETRDLLHKRRDGPPSLSFLDHVLHPCCFLLLATALLPHLGIRRESAGC